MENNQKEINNKIVPAPTFNAAFNHGWNKMKKYFLKLLLVSLIVFVAKLPMGIMKVPHETGYAAMLAFLELFGIAYALFVMGPIHFGSNFVFLKAMRDEKFEVQDVFAGFKENYLNVILATLLSAAIIIAGFFLFIIPGIVFACKLAFVPYLVMDKHLDPVEAVKTSWQMTKGHGWTIFAMGLVSFFIIIAGLIVFILGVIPAAIWISGAFASLYYAVDTQTQKFLS